MIDEARTRANALLDATIYFDACGLAPLAHDCRALARITIVLIDALEAERSARIAMQAARDTALAVITRRQAPG